MFEFGDSFIQWVNHFYTNCQSCVIVNGHLSEWFYLQRGCRQGDPLSPYLFVVCAKILAILVRQPGGIKGITIGNIEFLVSQYADDTSFILDGFQESLENCMKDLKLYAKASGLCVNIERKLRLFGLAQEKIVIQDSVKTTNYNGKIMTLQFLV